MATAAPWMGRVATRLLGPSATLIASTLFANVLRIANTMLLTRLVTPADFGLVGIVMSVFLVVAMVTDAGFQAFVVRHERGEDDAFLDGLWTIHVARGAILAAGLMLSAQPIALVMGKPGVAPLLAVAAVTFAIDGLASPAAFVAIRTGLVRRLSLIDTGVAVVQVAAGLVAALILRDAWAMIVGMIVASTARVAASHVMLGGTRRRFAIQPGLSGELWRFSRLIAASSILTLAISQVDKLILARFLTLPQFGVYAIASSLAAAPVALVMLYTSRILYPAIAGQHRADPAGVGRLIYDLRGLVFYGYLFASGGLVGAAPFLIRILYDPRYMGAAPFLSILAVGTALAMLTRAMGESLVASGHTRTTLMMNVARILWLLTAGLGGLVAVGPIGLVVALGLVELPAYAYGARALARLGLLSLPKEGLAFLAIGAGIAAGWMLVTVADMVVPA